MHTVSPFFSAQPTSHEEVQRLKAGITFIGNLMIKYDQIMRPEPAEPPKNIATATAGSPPVVTPVLAAACRCTGSTPALDCSVCQDFLSDFREQHRKHTYRSLQRRRTTPIGQAPQQRRRAPPRQFSAQTRACLAYVQKRGVGLARTRLHRQRARINKQTAKQNAQKKKEL